MSHEGQIVFTDLHLNISSQLFLLLKVLRQECLGRVEQVFSLGEVLLQGEIAGQVEAIDTEVLDLVRLIRHLSSHGL